MGRMPYANGGVAALKYHFRRFANLSDVSKNLSPIVVNIATKFAQRDPKLYYVFTVLSYAIKIVEI